ncbi:YD repeat-containing protein [Bosea sp. OK403]|nr:YD repeat-containing protein [Bosea sp. OK403]
MAFRLYRRKFAAALTVSFVIFSAMTLNEVRAANASVVYTYDALGRIASASYDTGIIIIYSYDANGNRTAQTINVNSASAAWGSFNWGEAIWHQ